MKLKDAEAEEKWAESVRVNDDPYGSGVIRFTERWADLMEQKLAEGKTVAEIYEATSHEADTEGITGFMYGVAVSMLSQLWEHGAELRVAHNAEYGVGPEVQGTVNPAIITIGGKGDKELSADEAVDAIKQAATNAGYEILSEEEVGQLMADSSPPSLEA